jgi:ABC-type transport system involved in cytochrome c biogenesis permease subunit
MAIETQQKWFNRWRIFYMACAELFGYRYGQEWWVTHYQFERPKEIMKLINFISFSIRPGSIRYGVRLIKNYFHR